MDNHFVPNLTIGPMVVKALRKPQPRRSTCISCDAGHPLVRPSPKPAPTPSRFHPESRTASDRTIQLIKSLGKRAGLYSIRHADCPRRAVLGPHLCW